MTHDSRFSALLRRSGRTTRFVSSAAVALALASLAAPSLAQAPSASAVAPRIGRDVAPLKEFRAKSKEAHEAAKAARDEARDDVRDARKDARRGALEAHKIGDGGAEERLRQLLESRLERRKEHRAKVKARWGALLARPDAVAELRRHAERSARLKRLRFLVETERKGKDQEKLLSRIDKLIERENARHERVMQAAQHPGAPGATSAIAAMPASAPEPAKPEPQPKAPQPKPPAPAAPAPVASGATR